MLLSIVEQIGDTILQGESGVGRRDQIYRVLGGASPQSPARRESRKSPYMLIAAFVSRAPATPYQELSFANNSSMRSSSLFNSTGLLMPTNLRLRKSCSSTPAVKRMAGICASPSVAWR